MNIFNYIVALSKLNYAIYLAEKAHSETGQRYYVLPDSRDRLIILSRYSFRRLKKSGLIDQKAKVTDVIRESFYFTPHPDGTGNLSHESQRNKRKMYLSYIEFQKKNKKKGH